MKLRKLIAALAAMLMLCSLLPISTISVSAADTYLGCTELGSEQWNIQNDYVWAPFATAANHITAIKAYVRVQPGVGTLTAAVYTDYYGKGELVATATLNCNYTTATKGWQTLTFDQPVAVNPGQVYYVRFGSDDVKVTLWGKDSATANDPWAEHVDSHRTGSGWSNNRLVNFEVVNAEAYLGCTEIGAEHWNIQEDYVWAPFAAKADHITAIKAYVRVFAGSGTLTAAVYTDYYGKGTLVATATQSYNYESNTKGWQTLTFDKPVAINPDQVYYVRFGSDDVKVTLWGKDSDTANDPWAEHVDLDRAGTGWSNNRLVNFEVVEMQTYLGCTELGAENWNLQNDYLWAPFSPAANYVDSVKAYVRVQPGVGTLTAALCTNYYGKGEVLAEAVLDCNYESATKGWQTLTFDKPVAVTPGQVYYVRFGSDDVKVTLWGKDSTTANDSWAEYVDDDRAGSGWSNNRLVNMEIVETALNDVVSLDGKAISDDVDGLAFKFTLNADHIGYENGNHIVLDNATIAPFTNGKGYALTKVGVIMSNDADSAMTLDCLNTRTLNIEVKYLTDLEADSASYAVRIIHIPAKNQGDTIYARPYYTYEIDGEPVTVYGEVANSSYEAVASTRRSLKVLAIGDSFSVDAMRNHLYDVLKSAEYDQVILGNLVIDDGSLDAHWSNISGNVAAYQYQKNDDNGKWVKTASCDALTALQDENWDVITIQQASSDSGKPETYGNLQNIVNWVNTNKNKATTKVLWHMTWAYQQDSTHAGFANYGGDQMTMYNAIVGAVQNTVLQVEGIDGVIPVGTAIQNLRTTALGDTLTVDGCHLNDQQGDYTAALTWYAAITGESLNLVDYVPDAVVSDVYNVKRAVNRAIINPYEVSDISETVLLAASDIQASTWETNRNTVDGILGGIRKTDGYDLFDGLLFAGDYTPNHGHDSATECIGRLDDYTDGFVTGNKFYAEGNHDAPTVEMLSPYGNNDPAGAPYGVFVFHEEDYGQFAGTSANDPAADLMAYFNEKIESNWDRKKPIFVMTHVPLHFSWRTISDRGVGKNAQGIVEALNYGGENGFNVIFLFGHNHSDDYDAYLGGASIYLAKGDTMLIANPDNYTEYQEVELKFTYLNAGYVGYHAVKGPDWAMTMTTFKIQADGSVIITRYDQYGYHNLKTMGIAHASNAYIDYIPVNETVYGPQRVVTATTDEEYVG